MLVLRTPTKKLKRRLLPNLPSKAPSFLTLASPEQTTSPQAFGLGPRVVGENSYGFSSNDIPSVGIINKNISSGDVVSFGGSPGMPKAVVYLRELLSGGGLSIFVGRAVGRRPTPID